MKTAISPTRAENYPEWYQQVLKASDLAEHAPVRGCMIIKPWGFSLWENMKEHLDRMIKAHGYQNAYFPLFIPLSYFEKEAAHIEGFAKECAVVTHHRLEAGEEGGLVPAGELEEPLIVRPTSEMIIGEAFSRWITSYRDLPLLINQWANVVRWEMRTRLFLRTSEFLWQEGHTVHATKEEALEHTYTMLDVYEEFVRKYLAIPSIKGEKTESERFPGADVTVTIEAMMQDGKALQGGTSHCLGQNFSKAQNIRFRTADGAEEFGWTQSFGITTRLIGALVMTHSDDDGLVLPPKIAPAHAVIIPIIHKEEVREEVLAYCDALAKDLSRQTFEDGQPLNILVDTKDIRGGEKTWGWIKKGIPLRIEVGPRDIAENKAVLYRRDKPHKEKAFLTRDALIETIGSVLDEMQNGLYEKALEFRNSRTKELNTKEEIYDFFKGEGGFASIHFSHDPKVEEQLKKDLSVTVRCIPLDGDKTPGTCPFTGKESKQRVIIARAY